MITLPFQTATDKVFGYNVNYLKTSTGDFFVKTITVNGAVWETFTPADFAERYAS